MKRLERIHFHLIVLWYNTDGSLDYHSQTHLIALLTLQNAKYTIRRRKYSESTDNLSETLNPALYAISPNSYKYIEYKINTI